MTGIRIGTQEEWQVERDALLKEEKELTRLGDALAEKRRALPWVAVEQEYFFETERGPKTLAELFDGRSQLLVYHFMFGPSYNAGCPVCSSIADTLAPQVPHLKARDTTVLLASRAPLEKLLGYRQRMGWRIDWVSSGGSDFNRDLGFLYTEEELKPFLDGEIPSTVVQNAEMCGTTVAGYVAEERDERALGASPRRVLSEWLHQSRHVLLQLLARQAGQGDRRQLQGRVRRPHVPLACRASCRHRRHACDDDVTDTDVHLPGLLSHG